MRKLWQSIMNLRLRTGLLLVLGLYFVMLATGAALGVVSLYQSNQARADIVLYQQARARLTDSLSAYKDVQVSLGRALASYVVNDDMQHALIAAQWGAETNASALSTESQALLRDARARYSRAIRQFQRFQSAAAALPGEDALYGRIDTAFDRLMKSGVEPLIDSLERGDVEGFQTVRNGTTAYLEEDLVSTMGLVGTRQQALIEKINVAHNQHYERVIMLVAGAIAVAVLISVLVYLFLGRFMLRPLRVAGEHFDRIAAGDLTCRIDNHGSNEIGQLYAGMRRMQEGLTRIVSEVRAGVDEITLGSREIFQGNMDLSARTTQQAASLQQTAASMEELDSTVRQNSDNATQADALAKRACGIAAEGGDAVSGVVATMRDIVSSSNQMSEIVSVIDGIAFQTNILALNAAVEAARAGEQGRGFAVVAGEVRTLAQRSAEAAREIKQLIEQSLKTVEQGSVRADEAGQVMQDVVAAIERVTAIVAEISLASAEQADGIGQVNLAVAEMDSVVQQNAALVEQAAAASGSLKSQATRLRDAVAFFRLVAAEVIDVQVQEQQQLAVDEEPDESIDASSQVSQDEPVAAVS